MENKPKIVALIPLRGGSKSIPNKNIKNLAGKPLCFWSLFSAINSKKIDEVWVSTEDKKIKKIVENFNLGVKIIDRPKELADDSSSTESVMIHFAEKVPFDILVTIQATSPLTSNSDLDSALKEFSEKNLDSMVTGVPTKRFFWSRDGKPLNYNPHLRPRRQDWNGSIMENGAFYITKRKILDEQKNRLGGRIGVYEMPEETAIEIDEPSDFKIVAKLLKKRKNAG